MGDRRGLMRATAAASAFSPFFVPRACLRGHAFRSDMAPWGGHACAALDDIFFLFARKFTCELLLIYFFVRWLDRHAGRRAASLRHA
ncbi:hypothetical protein WJ16_28845 [Burkholderia metallica]|nr:hypothetical protein WJ16_28845 [Burkholderia metallica]